MARSLPVENIYYHRMWGQLSTTCSNVLKQPKGELLVAVNHNQLRIMVSETVDPIDWSHPPPSWAVPLERHAHSINQCNLSRIWTCNRSMRGNRLAYLATQGNKLSICSIWRVDKLSIQGIVFFHVVFVCVCECDMGIYHSMGDPSNVAR